MFHSRLAEATLIGCLTALASFCALNARAGETYSIVAQSTPSSAATGRRPLAERIAAANLPIVTPAAATPPQGTFQRDAARDAIEGKQVSTPSENMAVAAVRVDHEFESASAPPPRPAVTPPVLWPFGTKWTVPAMPRSSPAKQAASSGKARTPESQAAAAGKSKTQTAVASKTGAAGHGGQRQASARSSGNGLSGSSPSSVTR